MAHLYIVYNADSTPFGKIKYACTKIMSSPSDSPCAACDLTHNGLHLSETVKWAATKKRIVGAKIEQLHRDELSSELKSFIEGQKLELPVVLGQEGTGTLKILMQRVELGVVSKDHEKFLGALGKNAQEQGIGLEIQGTK